MKTYFKLGILPRFRKNSALVLALKQPPELRLPTEIERNLASATLDGAKARPARLWMATLKAVRSLLAQTTAVGLLMALASAGSTLMGMRILSPSTGTEPGASRLLLLSLAFFTLNCSSIVLAYFANRLRVATGLAAEAFLATLVSRKVPELSPRAMTSFSTGNLKVLVTSDARAIGGFFDNFCRNAVPAVMSIAVGVPFLVYLMGTAGVIGAALMLMILPLAGVSVLWSSRFSDRIQTQTDDLTTLAGEWVRNIRLIRYLSWQERFLRDIGEKIRALSITSSIQHLLVCLIFGITVSWWMIATAGMVIAAHALKIPLDLAKIFGASWLIMMMHSYLQHVPNSIRLFGKAIPSMRRISELLLAEERSAAFVPEKTDGHTLDLRSASPVAIRFESVSFAYGSGSPILRDLSLELKLDESLAIIGKVASGKTTLLRLMSGELAPTSGRILVLFGDGSEHDLWIRGVHERLREVVAFVPQEPFVSNDSIGANIALSVPDGDEGEARTLQAAALAELDADIASFGAGVNQEIGENGVNLSGGQKQRLNLARAYFSGRPYFILDDTLSAVDVRTEAKLMERILNVPRGFALVTHRLGELARVNRVVVLDEGRIVEDGNPGTLIAMPDSHFLRTLRAYGDEHRSETEVPA